MEALVCCKCVCTAQQLANGATSRASLVALPEANRDPPCGRYELLDRETMGPAQGENDDHNNSAFPGGPGPTLLTLDMIPRNEEIDL